MADCNGSKYSGNKALIEFNNEFCGDVADPTALTFLPFGVVSDKNYELASNTTDATTDDDIGATASIVTGYSFTASVSGKETTSDNLTINQGLIEQYFIDEMNAGRQPSVWIRIIKPNKTIYAWCNITNRSSTHPTRDISTFEMSFESTSTNSSSKPAVFLVDTPA